MADLKFVLLGVDFVLCLVGGTMLGVGIWMAVDSDAEEAFAQKDLNEDLYWTSVYMMITIGCLVLIASVLGMLGAYSKSMKWALFAFIGILCLCLIMELVVIIITGVFWDSIDADVFTQAQMKDEVKTQYVNEYATDNISVKWNDMQIDLECCGADDYKDYRGSLYETTTGKETVPWTCCVMRDGGRTLADVVNVDYCRYDATDAVEVVGRNDYLHRRGCYSRMNDILSEKSIILIALTIAFAALEVVGLVLAFMVMRD